jgi:hypothetical protein
MKIRAKLLMPLLLLGIVGVCDAKVTKALAGTNAGSQLTQSLKSAHKLLAEADRDYKGHRAMAMRRVHMALKELGAAPAGAGTKKAARAGKSGERESQAASDAKMRQALQILQGISTGTSGKPAVTEHIKGAIKEINTALSVR